MMTLLRKPMPRILQKPVRKGTNLSILVPTEKVASISFGDCYDSSFVFCILVVLVIRTTYCLVVRSAKGITEFPRFSNQACDMVLLVLQISCGGG